MNNKKRIALVSVVATIAIYFLLLILPQIVGVNPVSFTFALKHIVHEVYTIDEEAVTVFAIPCVIFFLVRGYISPPRAKAWFISGTYVLFMFLILAGRDLLPANQEWMMIAPSCIAMWGVAYFADTQLTRASNKLLNAERENAAG